MYGTDLTICAWSNVAISVSDTKAPTELNFLNRAVPLLSLVPINTSVDSACGVTE